MFTAAATATAVSYSAHLIDAVGVTPAVAYSTRWLNSSYAGALFRIQRSSDSTETDIYPVANSGKADVSAIETFVGSGTGWIMDYYDQSGNSNDASAANTSDAAEIVASGGTVHTLNGIPCANNDGTATLYSFTRVSDILCAVYVGDTIQGSDHTFVWGDSSTYHFHALNGTPDDWINTSYALAAVRNGTLRINGTSNSPATGVAVTEQKQYINLSPTTTGAQSNQMYKDRGFARSVRGDVGEWLLFTTALSGSELLAMENNQSNFWGI